MPSFTLSDLFGSSAVIQAGDSVNGVSPKLVISLNDFQDVANGGEIADSVGIDNPYQISETNKDEWAERLLYALLIKVRQAQATNKNDDAEQKYYLADGGLAFGSGNRNGQVERRIIMSIFSDQTIDLIADIDSI